MPHASSALVLAVSLTAGLSAVTVAPVFAQALAEASIAEAPASAAQEAGAGQQEPRIQAPPAKPVPVTPVPPFPNRLNDVLPSWLRLRGELRGRVEGARGIGFTSDRSDLYSLGRVRLHATVTPSAHVAFQVQVQDARVSRKTIGATGTPFRAPADLRIAFADIGSARGPVSLRAGRQELAFGEQRLVGHVSWLNAARTFDAARLTIRTPLVSLDAFGASVVRILEDGFDRSGHGNRFAGLYATTARLLPGGSVEPYLFWRRDPNRPAEIGAPGTLRQTTVGVRLAGPLPGRLDYGIEMALQRGSLASDEITAWAGHWRLRHSLAGPGAVRLTGEYNYASGDRDPADGVRGTFDVLYPTPHDKYGLADQVGWKNIHHLRTAIDLTPWRGWPVGAGYHVWWLTSRHDALYTAGGAPLASVPGGAAHHRVGQEIDVQVTRAFRPYFQLAAGYAHIVPGPFLREATPGASYSHPYVMATYVFFADR